MPQAARALSVFKEYESKFPYGYANYDNRDGILANSEPEFLLGYLRAFETSNDIYYIDRFIRQADMVLNSRDSVKGYLNFRGESAPIWSDCRVGYTVNGECYPFTLESGLLSYPLLYFSMLVKNNRCLSGQTVAGETYQATAMRYYNAGKAAVDYHRRDWYEATIGSEIAGFFRADSNVTFLVGQPAASVDPLNYQTAIGRAYVLLNVLSGDSFYFVNARKIMRLSIEELYDGPNGSKIFNYWPRMPYYALNAKVVDTSVEDLSHLAITMEFFRIADTTGVWQMDSWMRDGLRAAMVSNILPSPRAFMDGSGGTAGVSYKSAIGQYSYIVDCNTSALNQISSLIYDDLQMHISGPPSVSGYLALPQFAHQLARCGM